jgi:hypothetical protein
MAQPLIVPLPPGLDLGGGTEIRVTALDPTTGNTVAGVNVSNVTLEVDEIGGASLEYGPFMLVTGPGG